MKYDTKNLAVNIRELRIQNYLSQEEFGAKFGVSKKK